MKIFTKQELRVLNRAVDILNAKLPIDSDAYNTLVNDCSCQPSTAAGSLGEIVRAAEELASK